MSEGFEIAHTSVIAALAVVGFVALPLAAAVGLGRRAQTTTHASASLVGVIGLLSLAFFTPVATIAVIARDFDHTGNAPISPYEIASVMLGAAILFCAIACSVLSMRIVRSRHVA